MHISDRTAASPEKTPWYWKRFNLFEGVDPQAKIDFSHQSDWVRLSPRTPIFSANEAANRVFLLEKGSVKIYHLTYSGERIVFWLCMQGDLFGAGGICGSEYQSINGESLTHCNVRIMRRDTFEALVEKYPKIAFNVFKLLGARLRLASDFATDQAHQRTPARLARILLLLAHQCGVMAPDGAVLLDVPITHQDIANMIGATRQTVNVTLKDMERSGIIRFNGRKIVLVDYGELFKYPDLGIGINQ